MLTALFSVLPAGASRVPRLKLGKDLTYDTEKCLGGGTYGVVYAGKMPPDAR